MRVVRDPKDGFRGRLDSGSRYPTVRAVSEEDEGSVGGVGHERRSETESQPKTDPHGSGGPVRVGTLPRDPAGAVLVGGAPLRPTLPRLDHVSPLRRLNPVT